jgi:hypothetical protein
MELWDNKKDGIPKKDLIVWDENYCDVAYLHLLKLLATTTSTGIEDSGVDGRR